MTSTLHPQPLTTITVTQITLNSETNTKGTHENWHLLIVIACDRSHLKKTSLFNNFVVVAQIGVFPIHDDIISTHVVVIKLN